jgi:NADPH-dependent 2,4-dienoyl-CoA reductase/sulfur reductase-like enzyme
MRRYVIIGTGAAGIGAAEAIREQDPAGELLLVSDDPYGYYSRPGLAYFLTGEIPERQLFPFTQADFRQLGVHWQQARAVRLHPAEHQVELHDGRRLPYDRLLIATGSTAVRAGVPGADLQGVVKLDSLEDARRILKLARRGSRAVVTGGGITALELVEGLRARGVHVTYFLRGDRYWSNVLDEMESRIVERLLHEERIQIQFRTELAEILGKRGQVAGARAKDGRVFPCSLVAVAIGVRPQLALASASGLKIDRGIVVDDCLQTSAPDVFAAGDVAQVFDPYTGQSVLDTLWGTAREQGRAAGRNMAGHTAPFRKGLAFNVTRLAGLTTTIIGQVGSGRDDDVVGIARGDSEIWRQLPDAIAAQDHFEVNRLRILVGKQRLLGAIVMGDQSLSAPLQDMVARCADIHPIRDRLLQPGAPLGDLLAGHWTQWKGMYADRASRTAQ